MISAQQASVIQATPLLEGRINLTTGTITIKRLIHCEADAELTLHFSGGDETYNMAAGDDRTYTGTLTIVSGTVTVD